MPSNEDQARTMIRTGEPQYALVWAALLIAEQIARIHEPPRSTLLDDTESCRVCGALVLNRNAGFHRDWHRGVRYVQVGERVTITVAHSEAAVSMGVAGQRMEARLEGGGIAGPVMAQLYRDGRPFSAAVTPGEAGFYHDDIGYYYHTGGTS